MGAIKNASSPPPRHFLKVWPLRTERDYLEIQAEADRLIMDAPEHGPLSDRLEVMLNLMEYYETRRHRIDTAGVTPLDTVNFLMEQQAVYFCSDFVLSSCLSFLVSLC